MLKLMNVKCKFLLTNLPFPHKIHLHSAVQLSEEEISRRKSARKKTAASYYQRCVRFKNLILVHKLKMFSRNQEKIRRKANDKYVG